MKRFNLIFLLLLILILSFLIFYRTCDGFRMPSSYNYDSDFGRDLLKMEEIVKGKFTLVGPQLSLGGLRLSPYHFYLFSPMLLIFNNFQSVVYFNGLLFLIGFCFLFLKFYFNFKDSFYSFIAVLWLVTSSYILLSSRSPGNAFSYLIVLILIIFYNFFKRDYSLKDHFIVGFIEGVIINYHPVSLIVVIPLHLLRVRKIKDFFIFIFAFLLSFLPVIIFDLRHQFVIFRSLINSVNDPKTSSIFLLLFNLKGYLNSFLAKSGPIHYYFPLLILFQSLVIYFLSKYRYRNLILFLLLIINIYYFPFRFYQKSRNLNEVEKRFKQVLNSKFLPKDNLNVVLINETHLSKVGYEYRYLLLKNNYNVDDEYLYSTSKYLLLISEKGNIDWKKEKSWELNEFGEKKLIKQININDYYYFLFGKRISTELTTKDRFGIFLSSKL